MSSYSSKSSSCQQEKTFARDADNTRYRTVRLRQRSGSTRRPETTRSWNSQPRTPSPLTNTKRKQHLSPIPNYLQWPSFFLRLHLGRVYQEYVTLFSTSLPRFCGYLFSHTLAIPQQLASCLVRGWHWSRWFSPSQCLYSTTRPQLCTSLYTSTRPKSTRKALGNCLFS